MPAVARIGDSISTGHGCDGTTTLTGPSGNVFANSIGVERQGDPTVSHAVSGRGCSVSHVANVNVGSSVVFVNNKQIARIGDSADSGSVTSGSPNVFAGDQSSVFSESSPASPVQISESVAAPLRAQTTNYISNSSAYNNPVAAANGVKQQFAPVTTPVSTGSVAPSDPAGNDIVPLLTSILSEAGNGLWRESGQGGNPSNKNILNIWKELGFNVVNNPWNTDQTAWCMGFLNFVLKKAGYRWAQEAGSRALKNSQRWNSTEVSPAQAQPGDMVLWDFGHVNFVYSNNNGKLSFCGGNQTPTSGSNNNPNDGDVTISWPSGWTPARGGITGIWRPSRS